MAKKSKASKKSAGQLYEGYIQDAIPSMMLTPSEAAQMNRETPNNAFMQNIDGEFYYPEELEPATVNAGLSDSQYRRAMNVAEANEFAKDLSQKQSDFGWRYVAPGLGATMLAPFAIGAGATALANPLAAGNAMTNALNYLQPSKYLDTAAKGLGAISPYAFSSGASTMAGGLADAAWDSAWAANAIRNAGKTGSVPGEILNAMDLIPMVQPVGNMMSSAYRAYRGARAADEARKAANIAAIKGGLYKTTNNWSGETVYVDPDDLIEYTFHGGKFVPNGPDYGWIPNTQEELAKNKAKEFDWDALEAVGDADDNNKNISAATSGVSTIAESAPASPAKKIKDTFKFILENKPAMQRPEEYMYSFSGEDKINKLIGNFEEEDVDQLVKSLYDSGDKIDASWANAIELARGNEPPIEKLTEVDKKVLKYKAIDAINRIRERYSPDMDIKDIINSQDKSYIFNDILGRNNVVYALKTVDDNDAKEILKEFNRDNKIYELTRKELIDRYKNTGAAPGRNDAVWDKVNQIIDEVKSGKRGPLPTKATDVFGEEFDLPDYMAAFMETDEFKNTYPNGVDFFWRGVKEEPNWHKAYTGYDSYFAGDRTMAGGYNKGSFSGGAPVKLSSAVASGEAPNVMLMYVPKGQLYTAPNQHGAAWNGMLHDGTEQVSKLSEDGHAILDEKKKLHDKSQSINKKVIKGGQLSEEEHEELKKIYSKIDELDDELGKINLEFGTAHRWHYLPIQGLGRGRFHTTDEIASALNPNYSISPDFNYSGVIIPDVQDGERANEIIWNQFRGGYPKVVHPDMTMNLRLGSIGYLRSGGDIHIKPSHRGRLTELKERTGKSEAELYNDGNPAHKKMVVFARNARKWNHKDLGGEIERLSKSFNGDYGAMLQTFNKLRAQRGK